MALTTLQSIQAEIKQLEERKKLVEKRDADVPKALAILHTYAQVLTPAQRRQVARIMGDTVDQAAAPRAAKEANKTAKKSTGKVAPKYQLPTGELWTGRGRMPLAFVAWAKSTEGKAWRKANPDQQWPPAPGSATAANKPVKKAAKKAAKAAKPAKKAPSGKKGAKKAVKKIARKAAKKA